MGWSSTQPVALADYVVDDRVRNEDLDAYLTGASTRPPIIYKTDEQGRFETSRTIGGPEYHDIWIVVVKEGFQDYAAGVWKGDGTPNEPIHLTIRLDWAEE